MPTVEDAITLAVEAHRGQVDRLGEPFILHPMRVMSRVETDTGRIIAALHDVVEKTDLTLDDLRARGYDAAVVDGVDSLSRRDGESYAEHVERIQQNPVAVPVKLADLQDHLDVQRWPLLTADDLERFQHYQQAWLELTK